MFDFCFYSQVLVAAGRWRVVRFRLPLFFLNSLHAQNFSLDLDNMLKVRLFVNIMNSICDKFV